MAVTLTLTSQTIHNGEDFDPSAPVAGRHFIPEAFTAGNKFTDFSIGQYVCVETVITTDGVTNDVGYWFNPFLFGAEGNELEWIGSSPTALKRGYFAKRIGATAWNYDEMPLVGQEPYELRNRNEKVLIHDSAALEVTFYHYFYMTADLLTWVTGSPVINHDRWLKDHERNNTELNTDYAPDVYGSYKEYTSFIRFDEPTDQAWIYARIKWGARFYDQGILDGAPEATSFVFDVDDQVTGDNGVDYINGLGLSYCSTKIVGSDTFVAQRVYLIRTDTSNNEVDFLTNYEWSKMWVDTVGGTGNIDGAFFAPSTVPSGSPSTVGDFMIDGSVLVVGAKYRLIMINYWDIGASDIYTTSHISNEFEVKQIAPLCDMDATGELISYMSSDGDHVRLTNVDRLRGKITLDPSLNYDACAALYSPLYLGYATDFKAVEVVIRDEATSLVIQTVENIKQTGGWVDNQIKHSLDGVKDVFEIDMRLPMDNDQGLYSASGNNIIIEWYLWFYGNTDDKDAVRYRYKQKVEVREYDSVIMADERIDSVKVLGKDGLPIVAVCPDDEYYLASVKLLPAFIGLGYKLLVHIDVEPFGVNPLNDLALQEEEEFSGNLDQLSTTLLFDVQEEFINGYASFKILAEALSIGSKYRIYVIVKV